MIYDKQVAGTKIFDHSTIPSHELGMLGCSALAILLGRNEDMFSLDCEVDSDDISLAISRWSNRWSAVSLEPTRSEQRF